MPYNPSRYSLVQPPQPTDPMATLSGIMQMSRYVQQMKQEQEEAPQRRAAAQSLVDERNSMTRDRDAVTAEKTRAGVDQATIDRVLQTGGDPDTIITALRSGGQGHLIPLVQKAFDEARDRKATFDKTIAETANTKAEEATRQQKLQEAHADYLGGIAASVAEHEYAPGAFFHGVALAHRDKMLDPETAGRLIAMGIQTPDQIRPAIDAAIAASPEQRKYAAEKAAKVAERADIASRRTRAITVKNPDGSTTERIVPDVPGASYTSPPKTGVLTAEQRATAERWKAGQLANLERESNTPGSVLEPEKLTARKLVIENSYRQQIGLQPLTALPAGWSGGGATPPPATASRTASKADVQKVATRLGITPAVAQQQLEAAGVTIQP